MSTPFLSVASPVWAWLGPLLRRAMQLERAANRIPGDRFHLHVLTAAELRALGVLSMRASGRN